MSRRLRPATAGRSPGDSAVRNRGRPGPEATASDRRPLARPATVERSPGDSVARNRGHTPGGGWRLKLLRRIAFLGFALAAGGAAGGIWLAHTQRQAMERPLHTGSEPFVYTVRSGATIGSIARDLEAAGLLESALRLELQARWSGAASRIKAGEYAFESGLTPIGLLDLLVAGHGTSTLRRW